MKPNRKQKLLASLLAVTMAASMIGGNLSIVSAADSPPMTGVEARKTNQPKFSGYRVWDIRDWTPEADPGSEFLRARIPLQDRITPFKATQANPDLDADAQIMLMQGDYGNAFVDGMVYNNTFNYHTLNFWQYTDYFSPWHGAASATTPEDLYSPENEANAYRGWETRYFEFGVLNIPNPAYTNAAHRNGVMSIACIYFDQHYRPGQTINELFVQDEDGTFPVAEKLIEMAEYFGYDGYFFNAEEPVEDRFKIPKKKFLARLTEAGLWTQYYDQNSSMDESKANWLSYNIDGTDTTIQDSVFVNYDWPNYLDDSFTFIEEQGINPFEQVFFGFENNQAKFSGSHNSASSTNIAKLYAEGTKNPRASIALFTPSDFYHRGDGIDGDMLNDPDSQWKIAERERMFFSGVTSDPTDTGAHPGYERPEVGINDASDWIGVADFTSERSVIDGSTFYTSFNVGKGRQYFTDGVATGNEDWTNITVQNLLPTWQWWIETPGEMKLSVLNAEEATGAIVDAHEATASIASVDPQEATGPVVDPGKAKLKVDFDFGKKYYTGATKFTHIGAYNGGSSLVVTGKLEAENLLHLYKTDLDVTGSSEMEITYFKPSVSDGSEMKLALIFQDDPDTVVYFPIPGTGTETDEWTTKSVDLSGYADQKIAAIGLAFNNKNGNVENYQMNIGEIRLTDGVDHTPAAPTGFEVDRAFTSDEMIVSWDLGDFAEVDNYELYATLSNGKRVFVGSNYDDIHYIKSLMDEKQAVKLELVAIGKDGTRSEPATVAYSFDDKVSALSSRNVVKEVNTIPEELFKYDEAVITGHITEAAEVGVLELSWKNPNTDYKELQIEVTMDDSADDAVFQKTVAKGTTSTQIVVPRGHGESYQAAVSTVLADGTVTEPIMLTGRLQDVYAAPYSADKVSVKGTKATFWCPDPNDWLKIHATVNGTPLIFNNKFGRFSPEYAVRAATMMTTTLPTENGIIKAVLEDYSGNFSEPIYIPYGDLDAEIDETLVPDATLREAIRGQAGATVGEVLEYTGDLNLSGKHIADFTGLELLASADTLNLSGSDVAIMDLAGGFRNLDISGCTSLEALNAAGSNLETITYGDASAFTKLVSVDLSGSKLDMTPGTPERTFADAVAARGADKDDIVLEGTSLVNLAPQATVEAETTVTNAAKLIDGDTGNYARFYTGNRADLVISFDEPVEIFKWSVTNYGLPSYGITDYTVQYSNDKVTWQNLGSPVTGSTSNESQEISSPTAAKYYKVNVTGTAGLGGYVREIEFIGHPKIIYSAGVKYDNQRPEAYVTYPESMKLDAGQGTVNAKSLKSLKTIRGTDFSTLSGADFIDADFDLGAKLDAYDEIAMVTDKDGNVAANVIDTAAGAVYQVDYVTFNTPEAEGEVKKSIEVTVGDGGVVIPPEDKVSMTLRMEGTGTIAVDFNGVTDLTADSPLTFQLDKSNRPQTLTLWGTNDSDEGETIIQTISGGTVTKTERVTVDGKEVTKYTLSFTPTGNVNLLVSASLPEAAADPSPAPNKEIQLPDASKAVLPSNLAGDVTNVKVLISKLAEGAPVVKAASGVSKSLTSLFGWDLQVIGTTSANQIVPVKGVAFQLKLNALPSLHKNQSYVLYHLTMSGWKVVPNIQIANGILSFTANDGYSPYILCVETRASGGTTHSSNGGGTAGFSTYWITAKADANGAITPAGETKVAAGGSITYTVTPNEGYVVDRVLVDGEKEVTLKDGKYTFDNVYEPYTITAIFKKAGSMAQTEQTQPEASESVTAPITPNPSTGDSNPIFLLTLCVAGLAVCLPSLLLLARKKQ